MDSLSDEQQELSIEIAQGKDEWLQEQVGSLQQQTLYLSQCYQQLEQELQATNREMALMNQATCLLMARPQLTFEEAEELTETLPAGEELTREVLARLLSTIYGTALEPVVNRDKLVEPLIGLGRQIRLQSQQLVAMSKELAAYNTKVAAHNKEIRAMLAQRRPDLYGEIPRS